MAFQLPPYTQPPPFLQALQPPAGVPAVMQGGISQTHPGICEACALLIVATLEHKMVWKLSYIFVTRGFDDW